ncbi:MAG TPA: hypothetical protein VF893_01980, partial [Candidatus Bathyarchaeia archaeon]
MKLKSKRGKCHSLTSPISSSDFLADEKGGDGIMEAVLEKKPFKNPEDVKTEVNRYSIVCSIIQYL